MLNPDYETIVIGAGVSGIGAGIELLRNGMHSFAVLERADSLGGTWRDNSYPGVAVDIPSISYCFAFEMDHPWSRTYAPGEEILSYLKHCAQKYGVDRHIQYGVSVSRIEFDPANNLWTTYTTDGATYRSRYVIAATGIFGAPKLPDIAGIDSFAGKTMHTARWDHDYDISGKRIGLIGTGASAVQVVPGIAADVQQLTVFQRTPVWVAPKRDRPISEQDRRSFSFSPLGLRLRRFISELALEIGTYLVVNYQKHKGLLRKVEGRLRGYTRKAVRDSSLHEAFIPRYGLGCKRPALSNDYLQSFNRDNVELVTSGIERITATGIVTRDGVLHEFDALILSTGFQTLEKGNAPSFEVVGLNGVELGEFWHQNRYQSYVGIAMPGFPNFFLTMGPYSGGLNWFTMLDAHLKYTLRCMKRARATGATRIEVRQEAHDKYFRLMLDEAEDAVFKDPACVTARSYYIDRHGDASLGLPKTPWWRALYVRYSSLDVFRFEV